MSGFWCRCTVPHAISRFLVLLQNFWCCCTVFSNAAFLFGTVAWFLALLRSFWCCCLVFVLLHVFCAVAWSFVPLHSFRTVAKHLLHSFSSEYVPHQQWQCTLHRVVSGTESLIPLKLADNHNLRGIITDRRTHIPPPLKTLHQRE